MNEYEIKNDKARDGSLIYIYKSDQHSVSLNYKVSPLKEIKKFFSKEELLTNEVVFIIGVGNGEIVNYLHDNYKDIPVVIIIEPFDEIDLSKEVLKKINESNNLVFLKLNDIQPLNLSGIIEKYKGLKFKVLIHPKYEQTESVLITKALELIKKSWSVHIMNINTIVEFRTKWITEPTLNLAYTYKMNHVSQLRNKFNKKGALLIAAGPSLNDNIEFIKKAQEHMYIFCVGSALKVLLENNINPDFVVVIDSSTLNYEAHFKGVDYTGTMIFSANTNHLIVKQHKGSSLFFVAVDDGIGRMVFRNNELFPMFPSVANSTLNLICYFGFEEVYLIGQDLAYRNNEYYAKGIAEGSSIHESLNNRDLIKVESNDGQLVETDDSLYVMLQVFNDLVNNIKAEIKIYNLSKHGAKIKDVPYRGENNIDYQKFNKDVQYSIEKNIVSSQGKEKVIEIVEGIYKLNKLLEVEEMKIKRIHNEVVNVKDMKILLNSIKKIRQEPLIEEVLLELFKYEVQQISNHFEYNIENFDHTTNSQRKEMRDHISGLFTELKKQLEVLINEEEIKKLHTLGIRYFN